MSKFDDIRPFNDSEVGPALSGLVQDDEFIRIVSKLLFPKLTEAAPFITKPLIRFALKRQIAGIDTIDSFQSVVAGYMRKMINRTTDGFTISGLENLDLNQSHLFISNHRDIALDSAFVNYALHENGGSTVRIATGDNLASKAYATDLMRLNKSFFVKRSVSGMRALFTASKQLSAYIHDSLTDDNESVWIAQRDGRAKDGCDRTEPAVLKMLAMSRQKAQSFREYIKELRIVPVAVSYEYDPCDLNKATELYAQSHGEYIKADHEDINSLGRGISGYKGLVHISFGEVIQEDAETPKALAEIIDRQIIGNYRLFPSNLFSYGQLKGKLPEKLQALKDTYESYNWEESQFRKRLEEYPIRLREILLDMYSNPVNSKLAFGVLG